MWPAPAKEQSAARARRGHGQSALIRAQRIRRLEDVEGNPGREEAQTDEGSRGGKGQRSGKCIRNNVQHNNNSNNDNSDLDDNNDLDDNSDEYANHSSEQFRGIGSRFSGNFPGEGNASNLQPDGCRAHALLQGVERGQGQEEKGESGRGSKIAAGEKDKNSLGNL